MKLSCCHVSVLKEAWHGSKQFAVHSNNQLNVKIIMILIHQITGYCRADVCRVRCEAFLSKLQYTTRDRQDSRRYLLMSSNSNQLHIDEAFNESPRHLHRREAHRARVNHFHGRLVVLHRWHKQLRRCVGGKLRPKKYLIRLHARIICFWGVELLELCHRRATRPLQVSLL